ncbi:Centrosomal protein of 192 kDa [Sciurus carolinensis]|uniref:Centrosomal protein of 192 kDa n=1 Tax=Sciurus carolinensis TaxID=30640 RepID=A0AA41MCC6_SCICA|nr:Centrosomal protein of 192 kDa [Sciurus carolinensis]
MDDFRGIAEESFPSFLTNSLLGNSGILENVTLSSNLGLPVAVSTLARDRTSTDNSSISRKKNYMESPHLSNALMKQSAFHSGMPRAEEEEARVLASSQDLLDRVSPLEQEQDSSVDFCLRSWMMNNQEDKIVVPDAGKQFEYKTPNSDFSHTILLENEKLMSLTSLEDSSDDDINDEEFYDDHLEAYFEQLAIPGMIYEDLGGQDSPEKDFKLPSSDPSQANENSSFNSKCQSGNNSSPISCGSRSSGSSETTHGESKEGHVVCLPGTSDCGDTGDSRRYVDGLLLFSSSSWKSEKERAESFKGMVPDHSRESAREDVLVKTVSTIPVCFPDTDAGNSGSDLTDSVAQRTEAPHQDKQEASDSEAGLHTDGCSDTETATVSVQTDVCIASLKPMSDNGISSTDILWSPTCDRRTCECYESVEKNEEQPDLLQSVIYQNEEGRWVTDLAYYTSFNNEQDVNIALTDEMNEDFRSGGDLDEQSQTQPSEGSVTLQVEALEGISLVDEHDVTLTTNKGKTEDTCQKNKLPICKDKLHDSGDSILRISTIASAIADASVSTDPSQLVAMMKALKNKAKDKTLQEDDEEDCSTVSHFVPNDSEKSNGSSAFDMEKYLTKTEISRHEGGLENVSRAGMSDIWDLSLPKEQTIQDIHTVDSCTTNISVREPKENPAALFYVENGESQESSTAVNSSNSVLTNRREKESAVVDMKPCSTGHKLSDIGSNEKAAPVSTSTSHSYSSGRSPRVTPLCFLEECEEMQASRENQRPRENVSETSSSDRHVTFEKHCRVSSTNVACHQKSPSESELSRLVCSHTDMSRLTYVSEQSTCPPTTADSGREDCKSDITSELSATIIQASPASSEERAMENLQEKVPFQNRGKGALSSLTQNKADLKSVTESSSLSSRLEDGESSQDPSFKTGEPSETKEVHLTSNPSELDAVSLALLSKPGLSRQARSASPQPTVLCPKPMEGGQRVISKDTSSTSSEFGGQIPNGITSGSLRGPVCRVTAHSSGAEGQNVPAVHPTLWTAHSLSTAPLTQQYVGALSSTGNVTLPQCHAGSTSACRFSGCCPYPADAGERVQSSMAMGIYLGPDLTPGLMGPTSLCHPCSNAFHQNLPSSVPSCTVQSWDSGTMSGFETVRVPEELKFPHACCVGLASQTHLSVLNPTGRWLQVSVGVLSISLNGEKVETEKKGVLDFGDLIYGGWKSLPLKLINRTHAIVPVRLIINANALVWRCFSFSKEPAHASLKAALYTDVIAQLAAPSVVSHVMPASLEGQTVHLLAAVNSSTKQYLPLKNAGNIEVFLNIKVPGPGGHFSVDPESLSLKPGEEHEVTVSFMPKDPTVCEERLQKLALRSNCTSTDQHLRLLIKGQDQDCFQIPLSGYGGTSNLILEGVKKLSDSYMVTVNDLIPGKESKMVVSVRNTGSRAAFVKAIGFKDSQKKILLDPKVLRIFPDKFVLKERTQEDVTIIYNPSDRQNDCKTATELSTVYFFGGDEISRQQYRSELGTSGKHSGNVSLDVLPVKGPQGSPFLSQTGHPPQDNSASEETWTVQPEHLVLIAPSSYDMAKTGCFQIVNNSIRLLKFELYWPAHCLTVTPQHGFIAPESKLQILVSPNSSLSTKQSMFPWSGLIYIHCDHGRKKTVKVQIREDLTQRELLPHLASGLSGVLMPAPEPSVSHLVKPVTKPPSTKVEIRSKTVTFPTTEPGKTSENCLELENHGPVDARWHLSSFAPPYVKGVDESGDVFRATYAAFLCSPISGVLKSSGIQKVSITFLPRDRGDYAQFWDVECHPVKEPHRKHTLRVQFSGQSVRDENKPENARPSTNALIKVDSALTPRRRATSRTSAPLPGLVDLNHRGVYAPEDVYMFLPTRVGESRTLKVNLRNNSFITHTLKFLSPQEPFYIKHSKYSLRARHYIHIPVHFKPKAAGKFQALLVIQTDEGKSVAVRLIGEAFEKD